MKTPSVGLGMFPAYLHHGVSSVSPGPADGADCPRGTLHARADDPHQRSAGTLAICQFPCIPTQQDPQDRNAKSNDVQFRSNVRL